MTDSVQQSFTIPPGFSEEEINCQLCYEDLGEDDELWLIRMPCDIELSTLDRQKIFLSDSIGSMSTKCLKAENGKSLECYAENSEIPNTCVILPKRQNGQLQAVKKVFKGAILISEALSLNDEIEIKSEKEDGHFSSYSVPELNEKEPRKKKKKSHYGLNASDLIVKDEIVEEQYENINNSTTKKKKSSKKKKQTETNSDYTDLRSRAETVNSDHSQKKIIKKHSSSNRKPSEEVGIKDEPVFMDFDDEFPTCSSQK